MRVITGLGVRDVCPSDVSHVMPLRRLAVDHAHVHVILEPRAICGSKKVLAVELAHRGLAPPQEPTQLSATCRGLTRD